MIKRTKFKVELELSIDIDVIDDTATTPYTRMGAVINEESGTTSIFSTTGMIKEAKIKKIERADK